MSQTYFSIHEGKPLATKDVSGEWTIRSPANLELTLGKASYSYAQIGTMTQGLQERLADWKSVSLSDRKVSILQAIDRVLAHKAEWHRISMEELGRTESDLEAEWSQFERWVVYFRSSEDFPWEETRVPRGVVAIIGSYVWPLVYTLQTACEALLGGNTVVLKPSEKATACSARLIEWMSEEATIRNALSLLVGDRELSRRLVCHENVNAVVFYGSFEVGMRVKQETISQPAKEVLLFLEAKNQSIILDDLNDLEMRLLIQDTFLTTGQHCRSVSHLWIHASLYETFIERFHAEAKQFKIGAPGDGAYAGPLIDPSMLDRYLKFAGISEREGAKILMRGKPLDQKLKGHYVTPTLAAYGAVTPDQLRKSVSLQTEILSPHVSLLQFENQSDLEGWCREMTHGLVASIWSRDLTRAGEIATLLPCGQVAINQSLLAWDPSRSYQAMKKSGNHAYHGPRLAEQLTLLKLQS